MMYFIKINNKHVFLLDNDTMNNVLHSLREQEDFEFQSYDPKDLSRKTSHYYRYSYISFVDIIEADHQVQ